MQDHQIIQSVKHEHQPDLYTGELSLEQNSIEDDWLSKEFNRIPFLLYKCWLILSIFGALITEFSGIAAFVKAFRNISVGVDQIVYMCLNISLILLVYGCGEMLFAMNRKKSRFAQRSLSKFQYCLIGLIILSSFLVANGAFEEISEWLIMFCLVILPTFHLLGGSAVLRAFKKNHPLQRQVNPLEADFLEQNQVIMSELSKYEQQLNRCPYVVYRWFLKFAAVFEISVISSCMLYLIVDHSLKLGLSLGLFLCIGVLVFSVFNAYARFEMEVAIRTRTLARSKKALHLLKISVVSSILSYLFFAIRIRKNTFQELTTFTPSLGWPLALFFMIPVVCLAGAIKTNKIIEQREIFVKFSSYTDDSYL